MIGASLRQAFEISLSNGGSTVTISHPSSGRQSSTAKALKHRDGGGEYFSFLAHGDLIPGCVISRTGDSESWIVDRIEPSITSDVVVKVKAYVHQDSSSHREGRNVAAGSVIIHADNNSHVNVQQGGSGNTQRVAVSNAGISDMVRCLDELRSLISSSSLQEVDKEDALVELNRIRELADKPKSPDLLKRINDRLSVIAKITGSLSSIAVKAAPVIELARRCITGG